MVEGKGGENLNKDLDFRWSHGGRQWAGKFKSRLRFQMVTWWKAKGGVKFKQRVRCQMVAWWKAKGGNV